MEDPIYRRVADQPRPGLFAASGFVLLAAVGLWAASLLSPLLDGGQSMALMNALYYLPFIAAPVVLYMRRHRGLADSMRLKPMPVLPMLSTVLLALMSVYAASALAIAWSLLLEALGLPDAGVAIVPETAREMMAAVIVLAAVPAVCEELLFRGFVLAAWESRGTRFAIGVSALLFALLHGNLHGLPAYLLEGGLSGYLVAALDSLYAGIIYHTVYNAACLIIPWLAAGQDASADAAVDGAFVLSMLLQLAMVLAMMAMTVATLEARRKLAGIELIPRIRRPLAPRERATLIAAVAVMAFTLALVAVQSARLARGLGGVL